MYFIPSYRIHRKRIYIPFPYRIVFLTLSFSQSNLMACQFGGRISSATFDFKIFSIVTLPKFSNREARFFQGKKNNNRPAFCCANNLAHLRWSPYSLSSFEFRGILHVGPTKSLTFSPGDLSVLRQNVQSQQFAPSACDLVIFSSPFGSRRCLEFIMEFPRFSVDKGWFLTMFWTLGKGSKANQADKFMSVSQRFKDVLNILLVKL